MIYQYFRLASLLCITLFKIIHGGILNPDSNGSFRRLVSCNIRNNGFSGKIEYKNVSGEIKEQDDFFCSKCCNVYQKAPNFSEDPLEAVKNKVRVDFGEIMCQVSDIKNLTTEASMTWKEFLESDSPAKDAIVNACNSAASANDTHVTSIFKSYLDKSKNEIQIPTFYGKIILYSIPTTGSLGLLYEKTSNVARNIIINENLDINKFFDEVTSRSLEFEIPIYTAKSYGFSNSTSMCHRDLLRYSEDSNFDHPLFIGFDNFSQDSDCTSTISRLNNSPKPDYTCFEKSQKMFLNPKNDNFVLTNIFLLNFTGSIVQSAGGTVLIDPDIRYSFDTFCSSTQMYGNMKSTLFDWDAESSAYVVAKPKNVKEFVYSKTIGLFEMKENEETKRACRTQKLYDYQNTNTLKKVEDLDCFTVYKVAPEKSKNASKRKMLIISISLSVTSALIIGIVVFLSVKYKIHRYFMKFTTEKSKNNDRARKIDQYDTIDPRLIEKGKNFDKKITKKAKGGTFFNIMHVKKYTDNENINVNYEYEPLEKTEEYYGIPWKGKVDNE